MNAPIATVVAVHDGRVVVSVDPAAACPRCAAGKGCGAGVLAAGGAPRRFEVTADLPLIVGDRVRLSVHDGSLVTATLFAYGMPLAGLVLSMALMHWLGGAADDLTATLVGGAGLAGGALIGRQGLRRDRCLDRIVPRVTGRAGIAEGDGSPDAA